MSESARQHQEPILILDTRPLFRAIAAEAHQGVDAARIARRFHTTLVDLITTLCDRLRRSTGVDKVVLSGGVFLNALLTCEATDQLTHAGFCVYRHRLARIAHRATLAVANISN